MKRIKKKNEKIQKIQKNTEEAAVLSRYFKPGNTAAFFCIILWDL